LLGDFGIARLADATVTDSSRAGTPAYAAPETAARGEVTAASDVFSLGSTIYAAVTGTPPFGTEGGLHAVRQRVMAYPVTVPDAAGPLRPVLEWLLVSDPAERPTAEDAARVLHDVANATPPRFERQGDAIRSWVTAPVGRAVGIGVAGALLVTGTVVVLDLGLSGGPEVGPAPATTPTAAPAPVESATAATGLGEVHTADPCALLDPGVLRDFGEARLERAYGGFARCDVLVEPSEGDEVLEVKLEFFGPRDPDLPEPDAEDVGVGRLTRGQDDGQACEREILLPDGNRIDVVAREGAPADDRCGMAEAAVQHAVTELRRGEVPRRNPPLPTNSLAALDACTLPDPAALARIPGLDPATADPGFARWDCDWSGDEQGYGAEILFDRHVPFAPDDGTLVQIGGREALVEPGGYADDGCAVKLVHRTFLNERNDPVHELVTVDVTGPPAPEQLCGPAQELAGAVAAALPSP
jgi:hypothetical protein